MKFNRETVSTTIKSAGVSTVELGGGTTDGVQTSIELNLSSEYRRFFFRAESVPYQSLYQSWSKDDGASFYGDFTNFDTYSYVAFGTSLGAPDPFQGIQQLANDAVGHIGYVNFLGDIDIETTIIPGSNTESPRVFTQLIFNHAPDYDAPFIRVGFGWVLAFLETAFVINPPVFGRINLIRLMQYADPLVLDGGPLATFPWSFYGIK